MTCCFQVGLRNEVALVGLSDQVALPFGDGRMAVAEQYVADVVASPPRGSDDG